MVDEKQVKTVRKPSTPEWATGPFSEFLDRTQRLDDILQLSKTGISMIRAVPKIVEVLAKVKEETGDDHEKKLARAKTQAELAQMEVDEGFPLLHAQTALALWAALESSVRLFIVRWLENDKNALEVQAIQKLQVKIGEYERLEGEDRFFYILDRLERDLSAPQKVGIARFESLLEPFLLSGAVREHVRRDLFELNQIRNVLVHRSGVVDRRLMEACPWLNLKVGETLKLNQETLSRYFNAVGEYVVVLVVRLGEHFGVDMSAFHIKPKENSTTK
jgi:hypothetical protein